MNYGEEPPTAPAGWYPDPLSSAGLRYWDGHVWTSAGHTHPVASAHPSAAGEAAGSDDPKTPAAGQGATTAGDLDDLVRRAYQWARSHVLVCAIALAVGCALFAALVL